MNRKHALRELIFICSLSRSGIANPSCEKGTVLDFEDADRTRCMVRSTFLIVTHESPSRFFFHAQSLIVSIVMWSIGTSFQSGSRWFFKWLSAVENVESRSIRGANTSR